jgi:hypothetical protein
MKWTDWLAVGAIGVAALLLWRLFSSKPGNTTIVQAGKSPWVAALDDAPSILNAVGKFFSPAQSTPTDLGPVDWGNPDGVSYGL